MSEIHAIGDLIEALIDYRGKTPPKSPSGVPLITAKVIKGGFILPEPREWIAEEIYDSWMRRGLPRTGDILITTEAPLGEVAQVGTDARIALAQRVILLRPDPASVDPQFLFHYLRSPQARASLQRRASGTTVSGIRQPELRAVEVPLLSRPLQEIVGRILDGLDGLIENNRERLEILEEMARTLYREWFVHFRFPGYENQAFVSSPIGLVPDGWPIARASDAITINPRVRVDRTVAHPFIAMADLDERTMSCSPSEMRIGSSGSKYENGDTLFARITPCLENGKTGFVQCLGEGEVGLGSTEFVVLRGRTIGPTHTYCIARSDGFRAHAIASMSGASGRQRVRNECFGSFLLAEPPKEISEKFEAVVQPMFKACRTLQLQSEQLYSMRDLLLPKLVAGQIDVSGLDLDTLVSSAVA
ncbi:restriction endonuclease subunit S [Candidatus Mycolicibacterium alkanivorans]|uniref:Restriction endonuclease subunit S n=1 Tax=Candidatus Mycolicibacterium alkanivorans TaxID=2954114 RepID=A0ABS9YX65_9MYCO|nr:restriction endonuclease subunit S [Candidatus Mycolicibacterium alkanivorans]MCI4675795.1 restriction endonuclease subunit S [Candidatus Mycolicibacterium alkanivorans]